MNDREFRRRAHAFLEKHLTNLLDENGRCQECGSVENTPYFAHRPECGLAGLIAAGPQQKSAGLRDAIEAAVERHGFCWPYRIARAMDAPETSVPAVLRDLGLVKIADSDGQGSVYGRESQFRASTPGLKD